MFSARVAVMSLLYKAGALVWSAGQGLVRATQDCISLCCSKFYCCAYSCQQGPCSEGVPSLGPYDTLAECQESCAPPPPLVYYCCWDNGSAASQQDGPSHCNPAPCGYDEEYGVDLTRSGPHSFLSDCEISCNSGSCCPHPNSGSQRCFRASQQECEDASGTFFLDQRCYQTPCPGDCYSTQVASPCAGVPREPISQCQPSSGPRCSPAVTATVNISGVDCYRDALGNCTSSQALANACNNAFILTNDIDTLQCMNTIVVQGVADGVPYVISVSLTRFTAASPPAAANTVCHTVRIAILVFPYGFCMGDSAESSQHCGPLQVTHTQSCSCRNWLDCSFTASGSLTRVPSSCTTRYVDFTNAQFSLAITPS